MAGIMDATLAMFDELVAQTHSFWSGIRHKERLVQYLKITVPAARSFLEQRIEEHVNNGNEGDHLNAVWDLAENDLRNLTIKMGVPFFFRKKVLDLTREAL